MAATTGEVRGNPMRFAYRPWISLPSAVLTAVLIVSAAGAKVTYTECLVRGPTEEVLFCDLDGDGLKDLVLKSEPNLLIFYQNPQRGFTEKPNQVYRLESRPTLVWSAKLGPRAESLLVMTSAGVTELDFTDRTGAAVRRQIISQPTLLPESAEGPAITHVPFSPQIKDQAPVILVPVGRDLQVWRRADTWQCAQTLKDVLETTISAAWNELGYDRTAQLSLSLGDFTSDERDDILLRTSHIPMSRYAVYAQNADGLFGTEPTFTWTGPWDWSWYCWVDINRDGHVDLIKNTLPGEPWLIPEFVSGKVLVRIYTADEHGQIPAQPQQVFRKNDWIESIPLVDVDGDGYLDLVLGYNIFDSRDGFRKTFTAKQLDFNLRFHFYRPGMGFPEEPDCDAKLVISMDHPTMDLAMPRRQYFETFVNLQGDFTGDGRKDLLVHDRADRVSVYPFVSRQAGFAKTGDAWFPYREPIDRLQAEDLNNDRISDLVMALDKKNMFRIFVSHGQ
jgi:hypothetical protein